MTRRALLQTGSASLLATAVSGCGLLATEPEGRDGDGSGSAGSAKGKEAPMLARLVEQGELPPVEERLPDRPLVVEPTDRVGTYGGTWNTALLGAADTSWLGRTMGYEDVMRWTPDWSDIIPNIAESVEGADDGQRYTITLRKGMTWSDGEAFTADDLVFGWDDVALNQEINPVVPQVVRSGDAPGRIEKVDDYTVRIVFPKPNGLFMSYLAYRGGTLVERPRHYLKDFHPKYNPDVEQEAKDQGFAGWLELFQAKTDVWQNKDLPRHYPWILTTELGAGNQVVAERNPYYFKTDPDGSQLPYIDKVIYDVVSNAEVILLKASNGELDFHTRHINTPANKPVLSRAREEGSFHFTDLKPAFDNEMVIALNLAHEDPVKREVFQNKDFRIGLSYAINREELIDTVYQAQGEPWQAAPREESEFYDEEFAKQYTEFDVDKANEHLDNAGYSRRDDQGFRLGPDGTRIHFAVEVAHPALIPFWVDGMELVVKYWEDVGISAETKAEDRSLFYERKEANLHDAGIWTDAGGLTYDIVLDPRWDFPYSSESIFATPWAAWFSSRGASGEKPPATPLKQMQLYWRLLETPELAERQKLFRQILQIAKEQFYVMGTVKATNYYGIVKNNFHNVPESMPASHIYATPASSNPEQYFIGEAE